MNKLKPTTKKLKNYKDIAAEANIVLDQLLSLIGTYTIDDTDEMVTETIEIWSDGVYYKGQKIEKWK